MLRNPLRSASHGMAWHGSKLASHNPLIMCSLPARRAPCQQARTARRHVLSKMAECSPAPRGALSPHAPSILTMMVQPNKVGAVIGQVSGVY